MIYWILAILLFLFTPGKISAETCSNYKFVVGKPVKIYGPGGYADSKLETFKVSDKLYGYFGLQETYRLEGSNVENLRMTSNVVIGRGTWGEFDGDGAWLMKVWKTNDGVIRGIYHAENCHAENDVPIGVCPPGEIKHKALAYAESRDGGKTFIKPNYPNNLIIYPDKTEWQGNGDFGMIQIGDYYYIYFMLTDWSGIGVARAPINGNGKPGTWTKYYQGSFSQPGIGGRADKKIEGFSPSIIYNQYLGKYIMAVMDIPHNIIFYISDWNEDNPEDIGLKWKQFSKIIVPEAEGFWGQNPRKFLGFMAYPGITGLNGESETVERSFYLTYTHFPQGDHDIQQSTKIVRKVDVYCSDKDDALVSFQEFKNNTTGDTIETVHYYQEAGYSFSKSFGYINTEGNGKTTKNDICYYDGWKNNFLKPSENSCNGLEKKIATAGNFVSRADPGLVPVYQCFDSTKQKHYLSMVNNPCPEQTWLVRYVYPTNYGFTDVWPTGAGCQPTNGDADGNGEVEVNDLILWYTSHKGSYVAEADFDGNCKVDIDDLFVWYEEYRR